MKIEEFQVADVVHKLRLIGSANKSFFVFENSEFVDKWNLEVYCYVFDLPLIADVLENKQLVAELKHLHSLSFRGISVCFNNLCPELTKGMSILSVMLMDGHVVNNLEDATHFVTNSSRTLKYRRAVELGIPICNSNWIKRVYQRSSEMGEIRFSARSIEGQFSVQIFGGMMIFVAADRGKANIERNLQENGATLCQSLDRLIDVALFADKNESSGEFKKATKLRVKCVSWVWMKESLQAKFPKPFREYLILPPSPVPHVLPSVTQPSPQETQQFNLPLHPYIQHPDPTAVLEQSQVVPSATQHSKAQQQNRPQETLQVPQLPEPTVEAAEPEQVQQTQYFYKCR